MIIIDGHNLIGSSRDIRLDDPEAKIKLLKLIEDYQLKTNKHIVVVFDKINNYEFERSDYHDLEVRYPIGENSADDVIIKLIIKHYKHKMISVVTEDNHLINYAKKHHASHIKSRDFLNKLDKNIYSHKKNNDELSKAEINKWLKIFKS